VSPYEASTVLASPADILRGASRVPVSAGEATTVLVSFAVVFRLVTQRCVTNLKTIAKETTTVGAQKYITGLCTLQFFCEILPIFFFSFLESCFPTTESMDRNFHGHFTTCAPPTRTKELSTTGTSCCSAKFSVFLLYANVLPATQHFLTKNKTTLFSIINLVPHGPIYTVFIRLNAAAFIRGRYLFRNHFF